jgi:hypothetical protein
VGKMAEGGRISRRAAAAGLALLPLPAPAAAQTVATPPSSLFVTHPEATAALSHLQARRWEALSALVRRLPPDSAAVLLDDVCDLAAADDDITGLADVQLGHTIAGALYVNWAWAYRGTGVGSTVVGDRVQAFADRLVLARESLERAIATDAQDGLAYNHLFRTLKGQSDVAGLQAAWEAFVRIGRDHKPIRAFAGMADALSGKWFGSEEIMLSFARANQTALEPVSHALICQVANESLLSHLRRGSVQAGVEFGAQQGVLGEVGAANDAYLALSAPDDFYQTNFANGQFSFFFSFLGLNDHARPYLQSMGEVLSGPWTLFEQEAFGMLQRARTAAGLSST